MAKSFFKRFSESFGNRVNSARKSGKLFFTFSQKRKQGKLFSLVFKPTQLRNLSSYNFPRFLFFSSLYSPHRDCNSKHSACNSSHRDCNSPHRGCNSPHSACNSPHIGCNIPHRDCNSTYSAYNRPHRHFNSPHSGCTDNIEAVTAHTEAVTALIHPFEHTATAHKKWRSHFQNEELE